MKDQTPLLRAKSMINNASYFWHKDNVVDVILYGVNYIIKSNSWQIETSQPGKRVKIKTERNDTAKFYMKVRRILKRSSWAELTS